MSAKFLLVPFIGIVLGSCNLQKDEPQQSRPSTTEQTDPIYTFDNGEVVTLKSGIKVLHWKGRYYYGDMELSFEQVIRLAEEGIIHPRKGIRDSIDQSARTAQNR